VTDKQDEQQTDTESTQAEETAAEAVEEEQPESAAEQAPSSSGRRWIWALVVIVVVLATGEGAFIWWYDQYMRQSFAQARQDVQDKVDSLASAQQQDRRQLEKALDDLRHDQQGLRQNLKSLLERNQHLRKDWLVLEAEYLVKLASHRLQLEQDVNTAIVALGAADERLKQTGDPGLIKVRERIANDIQALRDVPQPDVTGISLKLSALYEAVDNLPLSTPDPRNLQQREGAVSLDTMKQTDKWSELPAVIWKDLKSLIVVRHHDKAVEPLLSPEQRFFLIENIRLQLEQARMALLSDESGIYHRRLDKASEWLGRFFDKESTAVGNAIDTLDELNKVKIDPKLPDLSATYKALQEYESAELGTASSGDSKSASEPKTTPAQ
jgi:uroporphyrin-3 C-methyltransferase